MVTATETAPNRHRARRSPQNVRPGGCTFSAFHGVEVLGVRSRAQPSRPVRGVRHICNTGQTSPVNHPPQELHVDPRRDRQPISFTKLGPEPNNLAIHSALPSTMPRYRWTWPPSVRSPPPALAHPLPCGPGAPSSITTAPPGTFHPQTRPTPSGPFYRSRS